MQVTFSFISSQAHQAEFDVSVFHQENSVNPDIVEQMYRRNPILRYTQHPLHSPLLPLPYGEVTSCEYFLKSAHFHRNHLWDYIKAHNSGPEGPL